MSSIPEEIYFEIFLKVPLKYLLPCKFVCKTWFSLISSPDFVKMQHKINTQGNNPNLMLEGCLHGRLLLYSISHDSLEILSPRNKFLNYALDIDYPFKSLGHRVQLIGCCDGLVCLWVIETQSFCLWNPATREYKVLPKSNLLYRFYDLIHVFGYDHKSNDYKLIYFEGCLCSTYSLVSNSWKTARTAHNKFYYVTPRQGVVVSGDFHWLDQRKDSWNILSLDISNEVFKEMELPIETLENSVEIRNLGVVEGCLCVLVDAFKVGFEVWIMQDYGVRESWNKRFVITHPRITRYGYATLISSLKSGKILFNISDKLVIYNPKNKRVTETNSPMHLGQKGFYFQSLVPLNTGTYVQRSRC